MFIYFLGESGIRGQDTDFSFYIDPVRKETTGLSSPRAKAHLVISTKPQTPGFESSLLEGEGSIVIDHAGEYEAHGLVVYGVSMGNGVTNYVLEWDGITYAHLGNCEGELSPEAKELFEGCDVLMIPVGGNGVLTSKRAHEIISELEPRIVIPLQYAVPGLTIAREDVKVFLKESGTIEGPLPKFKVVKKDLPADTMKTILLES